MAEFLQNLILVSVLAIYATGAAGVALGVPRIMQEKPSRVNAADYLFFTLMVLGWPGLLIAAKLGFGRRT